MMSMSRNKETILVVDDEREIADLLSAAVNQKNREAYIQTMDALRFTPEQKSNITRCVVERINDPKQL